LLVLTAAFSWAMYSNLTVKYNSQNDLAGIPVIFLLSSLVFLSILYLNGRLSTIHFLTIALNPDLLYIVTGPTSLGYLCWYIAMKRGNKTLVTSISYFIPLFSLLMLWVKFQLEIKLLFWLATILLISGSYMCYRAFQPTKPDNPPVPH
jgi:drug/metabolite transporter (DMT)-like permease